MSVILIPISKNELKCRKYLAIVDWTIWYREHCLSEAASCIVLFCWSLQGKNFTHYSIADFDFEKEQESVRWQVEFNKAISVHTITTDVSMYKMHRYDLFLLWKCVRLAGSECKGIF